MTCSETETGMTQIQYGRAYEDGRQRTVGFLLSRGLSQEQALETAQAAWVRGWERRRQIRDAEKTLTWVNSIALNMYRSRIRKDAQLQEFHELAVNPKLNLAAIDVNRMLDKCGSKERNLLKRRYFDGCEIDEIASECRCSKTAVRVRLVRARRSLRRKFDRKPMQRSCSRFEWNTAA